MPRSPISKRRQALKRRQTLVDPIFGCARVEAFTKQQLLRHGKRGLAYKIMNSALRQVGDHFIREGRVSEELFQKVIDEKREILGLSEGESLPDQKVGLVVFYHSLDNAQPYVEVRAKRVGGDTRQELKLLQAERGARIAGQFIKKAASMRRKNTTFKSGDKGMAKLLALELIDAYDGKGAAIKMRMDMHRMAKANQAYTYNRAGSNQETLPI